MAVKKEMMKKTSGLAQQKSGESKLQQSGQEKNNLFILPPFHLLTTLYLWC